MELTDVSQEAHEGNVARLHEETARHHGDATAIEGGETRSGNADDAVVAVRRGEVPGPLGAVAERAGDVVTPHRRAVRLRAA